MTAGSANEPHLPVRSAHAGDGAFLVLCEARLTHPREYRIGLLYSTTGAYAAIARDALDGALMALDEVNADPAFPFVFRAVAENPGGIIERYHSLCESMLRAHGCRQVVGTVTSLSRKEVIPIIEKHDALLWYMCPYEGFECCDNVVYTGACPNQHIVPLFNHVLPRFGARACLVGSNYIWGWEVNRIAREILMACGGEVLSERYLPIGDTDIDRLITEIRAKRPDFVLNNLIGPSSYAFLRAYQALGEEDPSFRPETRPVVSCNLTECELDLVGRAGIGHLSTAIWFDGLDTPESRAFAGRAHRRFGNDRRLSAMMVDAYACVRILAEAVREAGTDDPAAVRPIVSARSFATPLGRLSIDRDTNHAPLRPHLGRVGPGRRFEVIERAAEAVPADPYLVHFDPGALKAQLAASGGERPPAGGDPQLKVVKG